MHLQKDTKTLDIVSQCYNRDTGDNSPVIVAKIKLPSTEVLFSTYTQAILFLGLSGC